MKFATNWRDYEIIATGGGEKLERWGGIYLLRPDPQAIWTPVFDLSRHEKLHAHYLRSDSGGGAWKYLRKVPDEWTVQYESTAGNLKFLISPTNFKHTGLFPEQAINWNTTATLCKSRIANEKNTKVKDAVTPVTSQNAPTVLNLFGYTGGSTVALGKSGAHVTHVDASKGMTEVCKRNCKLNEIPADRVRFIIDDCVKFVEREIRRGKKYDAVVMDPPSFGRGANGEVWKIEQSLDYLVARACELLSDKPIFFLINSYTTGLQPTVIKNVLQRNLAKRAINANIDAYEIGLPTNEQIVLPAGCSCLATFD